MIASMSSAALFSTPSAQIFSPRLWPSSISELTIVFASRLCGTFITRLLSIFISLNGIWYSCVSEE